MVIESDQRRLEQWLRQKVQINTKTTKIRFQGGDPADNDPSTMQMESTEQSFSGILIKVTTKAVTLGKWWGWRKTIPYAGKGYSWRIGSIQETGGCRIVSVTAGSQTMLLTKNS